MKKATNGLCAVHQPKDALGANSDDDAASGPAAPAASSDNESKPGLHEFVAKLDQKTSEY